MTDEQRPAQQTAALTIQDRYRVLEAKLVAVKPKLDELLPPGMGMTSGRQIAIVLDAVTRDPTLLECHPPSIVRACAQSTEVGLELGSPLGEAYLVPFKNSRRGWRKEAQFIAGYKGLVKLALGGPKIQKIEARIVRANDDFDYQQGTDPWIKHKFDPRANDATRGPVTNAYAIAFFRDGGGFTFEVMQKDELDRIKTEALQRKSTPWRDHEAEMYRKCPVRKLSKLLELSPLLAKAVSYDLASEQERFYGARDALTGNRVDELKQTLQGNKKPAADAEFDEEGT
jgi:recombination protein RecT